MAKLNKDGTYYTIETGPVDSPAIATASSKTAAIATLQRRGVKRAQARQVLASLALGSDINIKGPYGTIVVKFTNTGSPAIQ